MKQSLPIALLAIALLLLARPLQAAPAGFDHVPPATIRVIHVASGNNCRPGVPDGWIVEIPFESYLKRVVPHESLASWPIEALKAQAVAARTYAWRNVLANPTAAWHVTDTTSHQYMCDTTDPRTDAAVDATAGQHLTYNGILLTALFSAENSSPTRQNAYGHAYLSAVDDPVSFGYRRNGHGQGLSQWGSKRWADRGWRYIEILRHYYTGARVEPAASDPATLLDTANRPTQPYLRGAALWLELNSSSLSPTRARQYVLPNPNPGPWQSGTPATGGWGHLFPLDALPDLPNCNYRIEYAPSLAPLAGGCDVPSVLYLGIDRVPPALNVAFSPDTPLPADEPFTATLALSGSDATSGLERIGWSHPVWQQEAEETLSDLPTIPDINASGGRALRLEPMGDPLSLPFTDLHVPPGHYRLWLRLRTAATPTEAPVATLRLFDEAAPPLQRAVRYLRAADFAAPVWQWFFVDVDMTTNYSACPTEGDPDRPCQLIRPVLDWLGTQPLDVDALMLATRPPTVVGQAAIPLTTPDPLTLYASDQAGNVTLVRCVARAVVPPPPSPFPTAGSPRLFLPLITTNPAPRHYRYHCGPA